MSFIWWIFLLLAIAFIGWSMFKFYTTTPRDQSGAKRAMAALWAGLMALGAFIAAFFQSPAASP